MSDAVNHDPKVKVGLLIDVPVPGTPGQRGGDMILATDDGPSGALYVGKNNSAGFLRIAGAPAGSNPIESNGAVPLTNDWNAGNFEITAQAFTAVDENAKEMFEADAAAATRTVTTKDDNDVVMEQVSTKAGVRTKIFTDAANKILAKITSTAARTLELFDDGAGPSLIAKATATAAARIIDLFDTAGGQFVRFSLKTPTPFINVTDAAALGFFQVFAGAVRVVDIISATGANLFYAQSGLGLHYIDIRDSANIIMREFDGLVANRNIADIDNAGTRTHIATLINGAASYLWGSASLATPKMKIDSTNQKLQFSATGASPTVAGTLTSSIDWNTGRLGMGFADTGVAGAGIANTPMGTYTHALGAAGAIVITCAACIAGSQVFASVQGNDATMKSVNVVPGVGSFTSQPNAAATGNTKVAFLVVGPA